MSRKPIIAGNWKMNMTRAQATLLIEDLKPLVESATCDVVICVPYTDIDLATMLCNGTNIKVGAENVAWAEKGAFTGEISADMLLEIGTEYVIIGHSERRQYFGETDASVNARLKTALTKGLKPIVCVGETLEQREKDLTESVISEQVKLGLADLTAEDAAKVIIAYEPVWAIGTGKTATAEQAQETVKFIRTCLEKMFGKAVADEVRIQYGGSMNPSNVKELMAMPDIDGGLIGGASLKAVDFSKVVNFDK